MKPPKPKPHPDLKFNSHAYGWMLIAIVVIAMGGIIIQTGEIRKAGSVGMRGPAAQTIGWCFIAYGSYFLYVLIYKAKKSELAMTQFHTLKPFEDEMDGYRVRFTIDSDYILARPSGAGTSVFYYTLMIFLQSGSLPSFKISRRGRFAVLLWYLGPARIRDILTGNRYFDARYRISSRSPAELQLVLKGDLVKALASFDKNYPPIRAKNGWLTVTHEHLRYTEGPYPEAERIFDPHRGELDKIVYQLTSLAALFDRDGESRAGRNSSKRRRARRVR